MCEHRPLVGTLQEFLWLGLSLLGCGPERVGDVGTVWERRGRWWLEGTWGLCLCASVGRKEARGARPGEQVAMCFSRTGHLILRRASGRAGGWRGRGPESLAQTRERLVVDLGGQSVAVASASRVFAGGASGGGWHGVRGALVPAEAARGLCGAGSLVAPGADAAQAGGMCRKPKTGL